MPVVPSGAADVPSALVPADAVVVVPVVPVDVVGICVTPAAG